MNKLKKICWELTDKCNDYCKYCFAYKNSKELTLQEHLLILNNLVELGVTKINWSGGECLLLPHLVPLLQYAKTHNILNVINTNGKLLTRNKLTELQGIADQINLSLNSLNPSTNTKMGKTPGHEEFMLNRINLVQAHGIPLRINTVVTALNKNDIEHLGIVLTKLGVSQQTLLEYTQQWNLEGDEANEFTIGRNEFNNICQIQKHEFPTLDLKFRTQDYFSNDYIKVTSGGALTKTSDGHVKTIGNPLEKRIMTEDLNK